MPSTTCSGQLPAGIQKQRVRAVIQVAVATLSAAVAQAALLSCTMQTPNNAVLMAPLTSSAKFAKYLFSFSINLWNLMKF